MVIEHHNMEIEIDFLEELVLNLKSDDIIGTLNPYKAASINSYRIFIEIELKII